MRTRANRAAKAAPTDDDSRPAESPAATSNRVELTTKRLDAERGKRPHGPTVIWDTGQKGLCVLVNRGPKHERSATLCFRVVFYLRSKPGKPVYMRIGRYPDETHTYTDNGKKHTISCGDLKAVRRVAALYRARAEQGDDPRRPKLTGNFKETVDTFIDEYASKQRACKETRRIFDRYVVPEWADKNIKQIKKADISTLLSKIENGRIEIEVEVKGKKQIKKIGTLAVARATRAQLVSLFSWYETKYSEDDFRNPVPKLMKNDPLKAPDGRERALENHEIRALWEACNEMGDAYAACVQTALLTAQRFHKVSRMRRSDLKDGVWDATRPDDPKNKRVSIVALAPLALDVINDVPEIVVEDGADYVFTVTGRAPLRGWSKYKARLDRAMLGVLRRDDPQATLTPWQHRDLRRTARTIMAGEGVSDAVAEHCLGHVQSKIQRTYNRHDYASEKRLAFAKVAEYIERAINPPTDNVLPFEKRDGR